MDGKNEESKEITKDKFCVKCGTKVEEDQIYCASCGSRLDGRHKKIKLNKKLLIIICIFIGVFTVTIGRHMIIFNKVVSDYEEECKPMGYEVNGNLLKNTIYIDTVVDLEYDDSYYSNSAVKSLWGQHEILAEDITSTIQSNIKSNYNIKVNVSNRLYDSNEKLLLEGKNGEITYNIER